MEFGNTNTSSLINMEHMFVGWTNLESIDLSKFDKSEITSFYYAFNEWRNKKK